MHVGWNCDSRLHRHSYKLLSVLQPERAVEKGGALPVKVRWAPSLAPMRGCLCSPVKPVFPGPHSTEMGFHTPVAIFCSVDTVQWVRARGPWVPLPDPSVTVMSLFVG